MRTDTKTKLEKELTRLQNIFNMGHNLKVKHLPNEIRYSQNGKLLSGEVNGDIILIYEDEECKAMSTLYHEFVEYIIMPLIKDYVDIINNQNKIIFKLLCGKKEETVERLSAPLH